ncbi:hypothetical protein KVR01_008712 [Diaporthe batatas]|uniref:uncharacterized protein n=1 Tax=Diaporthe batatas TaxID=748121 RepID=UPI001D03C868|nr:uncharacterized protein KVR01_008712 [Diaporthe batatas]KAG8161725.1 hypothetical protein KVR01_008712 [Diaporthe batatas]
MSFFILYQSIRDQNLLNSRRFGRFIICELLISGRSPRFLLQWYKLTEVGVLGDGLGQSKQHWNSTNHKPCMVSQSASSAVTAIIMLCGLALNWLKKFHVDIHGHKRDLKDTFIKTPLVDGLGDEDDGLLWERDPEKHRRVSKAMSPAFSGNSLRSKLPTMNKHIDLMVKMIGQHGVVDISSWLEWLCMDTAADLAWGWEMHQVRDMKSHGFLEAMEAGNFLVVILAAAKTYPFLYPLALMFAPWKVMRSLPRMISEAKVQVVHRIKRRYDLKHSDYFEQLLPADRPSPTNDKQISHMLTVAGQLILGGYDPTSVAIYMGFYFLLRNPTALKQVRQEVRENFQQYEDIEAEALRALPFLNACLQETLRLSAAATHHSLPRISPGAMVNKEYISKGVICRNSLFAYGRSVRFFHNSKDFRLERWLPESHPSYDPKFSTDQRDAHYPFIMGPRQCPGREVARHMFRLVIAKVLWSYDVEQLSKPLDFDRDFRVYSMWVKPELRICFTPAKGQGAM